MNNNKLNSLEKPEKPENLFLRGIDDKLAYRFYSPNIWRYVPPNGQYVPIANWQKNT